MNKDNDFTNFYQKEVDGYNFEARKDSSHIPVNYAKLILAKYGTDVIYFDRHGFGWMHYWCDLVNGNQAEIIIRLEYFSSCDSEYEPDDFEILERHAFIIEHKNEKGNSFLFDCAKKGIEGISINDDGDKKKYLVI